MIKVEINPIIYTEALTSSPTQQYIPQDQNKFKKTEV